MPEYRVTLDNGQAFTLTDQRNFKDFADYVRPEYARRGMKVAQVVNLSFKQGDLGLGMEDKAVVGGKVVEIEAVITEKPATKTTKKAGSHGASKLTGPSNGGE